VPDHELTRREVIAGAAATAAATLAQGAPPASVRPVAIAKHTGLNAVKVAVERMATGERPVDAAVAGVSLVEADPDDVSVGYGGIPNEEGVVQLDAAVMDGASMRAGAVAALERIKHPSQVALAVMRRTTRILLVGEGALKFARAHGFAEENLLTERSRKIWLHWKDTLAGRDDWLPDPRAVDDPDIRWFIERQGGSHFSPDGTIHVSACAADGSLGCCTSTSGLLRGNMLQKTQTCRRCI
jgi:N4-(beta-N-acetylglucosaminyl)-L-asparaginase